MTDSVREHLPVLIVITVAGLAIGAFAMIRISDAAGSFDSGRFSLLMLVVVCAIMLVCSFAAAATAQRIERQLYVIVLAICFVCGLISLVASSIMMSNPDTVASLQANAAEGAAVVPDTASPVLVMRDIAAFVVSPTIGCIAGAWVGSRIHPMTAERRRKSKR